MSTTSRPDGNVLPPGTSRIGYIVDGDERTPFTTALLENTGTSITLTVPWLSQGHGREYQRWFSDGIQFGDDPDRMKYAYEPPQMIEFHDPAGSVQLLFCTAGRSRWAFGGPGDGVVQVGVVVLSPGRTARYERICGLRSELHGLGDWMDMRSLQIRQSFNDDGTLLIADLHLESPPSVAIDRGLNLKVVPSYSVKKTDAETTAVREEMFIETRVTRERDWEDHLAAHRSVRDLLIVSSWRKVPFSAHRALHARDPQKALAGNVVGPAQWKPVESYRTGVDRENPTTRSDYLFTFPGVGAAGFRKWIQLRKHFARGIDPMISSAILDAPIQTKLAEVGMGFEAIGYRLALDAELSEAEANGEKHKTRLARVVSDMVLEPPIEDLAGWPARSAAAYNSIKHANRAMPEHLELLNAWREAVEVFRYWVAGRIGVSQEHVASHRDRLSTPFQYA